MPATSARPSASHGQHLLNGRVQRSMKGWAVIEKIVDFTHAVCRLSDGRGSATLIALPSQQSAACSGLGNVLAGESCERSGVLLTTTFVLPACDSCQGATVTFLEQPVAGTSARQGQSVEPVVMPIRAEKFFACSTSRVVQQNEGSGETEENLGYTLTLCDMNPVSTATTNQATPSLPPTPSTSPLLSECTPDTQWTSSKDMSAARMKSAHTLRVAESPVMDVIRPLPLPLLLSKIAPVCVGDTHLMITHINGIERHYVVQTVKSVEKDSCEYEFFDPSCEFSSGGPIFNMQGNLVGIQHQNGDRSYGIFISSIVRHLFDSMLLGICRMPIAEHTEDEAGEEESAEVFNEKLNFSLRGPLFSGGAAGELIEYEEFKRMRVRKDFFCFFIPPYSSHVWEEFYTDFPSLVHILHAFSHSPRVAKLALETMTSHEHRHQLPNIAALGGIGAILEIIDGYPQNEEMVVAALNVLARASLYPINSEAIFRCDGILTVLEIMNEYSHQPCIQQWGFYCLYNLMAADSPDRVAAIDLFNCRQGIALATEALRVHHTERHVLRHASLALSRVAYEDQGYMRRIVCGGLVPTLIERLHDNLDDAFVFIGLVTLLEALLCHVPWRQLSLAKSSSALGTLTLSLNEIDDVTPQISVLDMMRSLINTLLEGQTVSVLTSVIAREGQDKYSCAAVSLLEKCVESVLVLIASCSTTREKREADKLLADSCRTVMQNFMNEQRLLAQAKEVIELLNIG